MTDISEDDINSPELGFSFVGKRVLRRLLSSCKQCSTSASPKVNTQQAPLDCTDGFDKTATKAKGADIMFGLLSTKFYVM